MSNQSWTERLTNWMQGRNGSDELGNAAVALSVILLIINVFARFWLLSLIAFGLALYACWRMSSKDVVQRRAENERFIAAVGPAAAWFGNPKAAYEEKRDYKHLTCPACGKKMRVPRGKGRMRVTCPACHEKFETRT